VAVTVDWLADTVPVPVVLNAPDVPASALLDAASGYPVPTLWMLSVENVAPPLTAATLAVPDRVPPPGFAPMAMVTVPVNVVAVFPAASCAATFTGGAMLAPAVASLGCTVNTSCVGVTGGMLKRPLVTPVRPVDVARRRYPFPALLIDRSEKVATPATAATVFVPDSVPLPGFEFVGITRVMFPVN